MRATFATALRTKDFPSETKFNDIVKIWTVLHKLSKFEEIWARVYRRTRDLQNLDFLP
jgi:hypothetical protein